MPAEITLMQAAHHCSSLEDLRGCLPHAHYTFSAPLTSTLVLSYLGIMLVVISATLSHQRSLQQRDKQVVAAGAQVGSEGVGGDETDTALMLLVFGKVGGKLAGSFDPRHQRLHAQRRVGMADPDLHLPLLRFGDVDQHVMRSEGAAQTLGQSGGQSDLHAAAPAL